MRLTGNDGSHPRRRRHGGQYRPTTGNQPFRSWICRIVIRRDETGTLSHCSGHPGQSPIVEGRVIAHDDRVDPVDLHVLGTVRRRDDLTTRGFNRLPDPRAPSHQHPIARVDERSSGLRTRDHVTCRSYPDPLQSRFLLTNRGERVVRNENDAVPSVTQARNGLDRTRNRLVHQPDDTIDVAQDGW